MWSTLELVKKHLSLAITLSMGAALLVGWQVDTRPLRALVVPLTIGMVLPMMVAINPRVLLFRCAPKVQLTTQYLNFVLIPLVGWGVGLLFFRDQPMVALGLLLVYLFPTSGMTVSWTGFARGNIAMATKMSVVVMLLGSLLAPFYVKLLLGASVSIPLAKMFVQIGWVVGFPLLLGLALAVLVLESILARRFVRRMEEV